ncbi:hypothetical protein A9Q97_02920 [Rhodospirillales bacterium 47_12_T64]|nr:hypothetical protein A9Q97_02920 [Rhodospirillales bacterium 47_12_T64]
MAYIFIKYSPDAPYKTFDTKQEPYEKMVRDMEIHLTQNGLAGRLEPILGFPRYYELDDLSKEEATAFKKTFPELPPRLIT